MSKKNKCTFNNDWINEKINPQWSKVFCKVQNDSFSAYCTLCRKTIDLSNMGRQALTSHEKSRKHVRSLEATSSKYQKLNFKNDDNNNNPQQIQVDESNSNCAIQQKQSTVTGFVFHSNVIDAEILWCLTVVATNMSYNSCSTVTPMLKVMFPDSEIAQKMTLGYTKAAYTVSYGLAEYFKEGLDEILATCDNYVICFDEAMNKIVQSGQMDLHIRIFHEGQVVTRYLTSVFMKYTSSEDILKYFLNGLKTSCNPNRILQISMDGPHVNWKFFSLLKQHQAQTTEKQILDIGSCGLHIVHGALQTGHKACKWQVNEFMRGIYYLFKDSPRRRNDFTGLTKCAIFPKKFCVTRWVENVEAAKTALKLVDNIKIYVEHKNTKLPSNFSIKNVKVGLSDPLIKAKLAFFELIASLLEPFLRKYQTDKPMLPYLFNDLEVLLRNLVERFMKPDLKDYSLSKLLKINFSDKTLQKQTSNVDVGFSTRKILSDKTINEKEKLLFLKDCQTFLQACVKKLVERCCLKYSLVKSAASLNPKTMLLSETKSCSLFNTLLQILFEHNIITSSCAELAKIEYSKFLTQFREAFTQYCNERLDTFFFNILNENLDFTNVWSVFKLILILSHGNASVESGFSVNKSLLVENLHEETLVNQRFVYDTIKACGGINNIAITDKLRRYAKNAYSKYKIALEERTNRIKTESEKAKLKRQAKQEILNLENKKKKLELNTEQEASQINREIDDLRKYL